VGDENFYNTLQKYDWYYSDIKKEFEVAQKYIKTTDKVLEVGSGKGNFAKYLNTANYIGLDFSQEAKRMAAENGIKIENDSIEDFSEKNMENFDVVASFQVLEHVKNPDKFIEAKLKALKKGGKLIFAVPNDGSFVGKVSNHALNMPPHHVSRWNRATFEFIAQKYHLKILAIDCEQMQPPHIHWWLATKIQAFFLKPKLIDLSLKRKILSKFSFFIVKFLKFFVNRKKLPFGHTITVVFQK
ncbi:MAG: class I SAM-dependent methyltransferase, partial [Raineya sp.]